jgi:hypothetical protein
VIAALVLATALDGWRPGGVVPTLIDGPSFIAKMIAAGPAAPSQRVEHWTYRIGTQTIPVSVAVRGSDHRVSLMLAELPYASGVLHGEVWRSDGNGVVHRTLADLQGDAADRVPDTAFALDPAMCSVVGERAGGSTIVVAETMPSARPHWFDVDAQSGIIRSEQTKEGHRVYTYRFERSIDGTLTGWHVDDGNRAHDVDVHVVDSHAQAVAEADVAIPTQPRVFSGPASDTMRRLPAHFRGNSAWVDVDVAGHKAPFLVDSGTENISMFEGGLRGLGYQPILEHVTIPTLRVGDESLVNAGVYVPSAGGSALYGILGYDWFFGHVVHISYEHQVVEVGDERAAASIFADPATIVLPIDVSQSIPFASAAIDGVTGATFALDTGSRQLMVFAPFFREHPEAAGALTSILIGGTRLQERTGYLEGDLVVEGRQGSRFEFASTSYSEPQFLTDVPAKSDLQFPFDGIIGTDVLSRFDLWFDYDRGRLGLRRVP